MQATISYSLTEAAQRAQMAATGQPVARQQTITVEVSPEDLPLCDVAADGSLTVGTAHRHEHALVAAGWHKANPVLATVYQPDVLADIRRGQKLIADCKQALFDEAVRYIAEHEEISDDLQGSHVVKIESKSKILDSVERIERQWDGYKVYVSELPADTQALLRSRYECATAARQVRESAAIDAFLGNPAARMGNPSYRTQEIRIAGETIDVHHPRHAELYAEILRRNDADAAIKAATEAAKEQLKTAAIEAWISGCGDALLQEQYADKLLCRKTVISRMANATLDALGLPAEQPDSKVCDSNECPCGDKVLDCIPPSTYTRWKGYGPLPEGSIVEFRRVRECLRDEEGDWYGQEDGATSAASVEYHAIVTVPSGPFQFTRRIRI